MADTPASRSKIVVTGIAMVVIGFLISLTGVGALLGIPLIILGGAMAVLAALGVVGESENGSEESSPA